MLIKTPESIKTSVELQNAEHSKYLMDMAIEAQISDIFQSENESMMNPEYGMGRSLTSNLFEKLVSKNSPKVRFYEHPFNKTLKFMSLEGWTVGSEIPFVLYSKGTMPENTVYSYEIERIPVGGLREILKDDNPQEVLFREHKRPLHVRLPGWKRSLLQAMTAGFVGREQMMRIVSKYGSSRSDLRFQNHLKALDSVV